VSLPLASAPTGSVRRLGFVGHCVGMANVGSRAPDVSPVLVAAREGGPLPQERQTPPIKARDGNLP
jgi:hypothetical protein